MLTPEKARAGTNVIMSYSERQSFLRNSQLGKLLGFERWPDLQSKETSKFVISKLYTDNWTGNKNEENVIENPTLRQIERAIFNLDGKIKTLVSLESDDESYMMIGGGNSGFSGKYVVTATLDNYNFYSLLHQPHYDLSKLSHSYKTVITLIKLSNLVKKQKNNADSQKDKIIVVTPKLSHSKPIKKLVVGGQLGNYPSRRCVNLDQCLIAAITFADSGELESLFTWEEDESLVTV